MLRFALLAVAACGYPALPLLGDGGGSGQDACVGMQCQVVNCSTQSKPPTSISGTVFAPNGTLPLSNVAVYVPNADPGPLPTGVTGCTTCAAPLPGQPIVQGRTDAVGHFKLLDAPAGDNIPLVIVTGKWRRQITIPHVDECADLPIDAADTTLPKNHTDLTPHTKSVDMPKIAVSTGAADALECLVRKLGIDDAELGTDGGGKAVDLFADTMAGGGQGANSFANGFPGGSGSFSDSSNLWNQGITPTARIDKLKTYDMVILSCEGSQNSASKPQVALDAMKGYADAGGRVFLSHWHNIWIEGATTPVGMQTQPVWSGVAMWNNNATSFGPDFDIIDEQHNPRGMDFGTWFDNVAPPGTMHDKIAIQSGTGKNTVQSILDPTTEQWTTWTLYPQAFMFTTPLELPVAQRCGRVAFSDMHVFGSTSTPGTPFPGGCSTAAMAPQELALAFMIFDLFGCVGG